MSNIVFNTANTGNFKSLFDNGCNKAFHFKKNIFSIGLEIGDEVFVYIISGGVLVKGANWARHLHSGESCYIRELDETILMDSSEPVELLYISNSEAGQFEKPLKLFEQIRNQVEQKDIYTLGHSSRVSDICTRVAHKLNAQVDMQELNIAAACHDVGKCNTPTEILQKPDKLTVEEFEIMKRHTIDSYDMLKELCGEEVARIARSHHERIDGSGYPDGIKGDQLSIQVRIIAVADAYDAMTSTRIYNLPVPPMQALAELQSLPEKFDHDIVAALRQLVESDEI